MVALCRLCGLPARYVSGHLLGEGGTHAWVEVLVPHPSGAECLRRARSIPTHDRRAGPRYVTVAVGRDYGDVPPTSGTFEGPVRRRADDAQARGRRARRVPASRSAAAAAPSTRS